MIEKMPISMTKAAWTVVALLVLLGAAAGCGQDRGQQRAARAPQVTVAQPKVQDVTEYAEFTGTTRAFEAVEIRARVEGVLHSMHFKAGAQVTKGQLLFVIDPKPYQAQLQQAEAELAVRQAQRSLAQATLVRKQRAYKERAVSEVDVIQARADLAQAEANIKAAEANVRTARIKLGYTQVHSPIEGRVSRTLVDVGNLVGQGEATLLAKVVDHDPIYVYFSISERELLRQIQRHVQGKTPPAGDQRGAVQMGLSTDEGYPHIGQMDYLGNQVDSGTGTIEARAVFPNRLESKLPLLVPGLFARLRLPIGLLKNARLVPERALGADQQGRYLMVVGKGNKVERRLVKIGPLVKGQRVITEGLNRDDWVIINGLLRVRPGVVADPIKEGQKPPTAGTPAKPAAPGKKKAGSADR